MSKRILVFNSSAEMGFTSFAKNEAVDLFHSKSGVTLIDVSKLETTQEDDPIWPFWPKRIENDERTISDHIFDELIVNKSSSENPLTVVFLVDKPSDLLPEQNSQNATPPFYQAFKSVTDSLAAQKQDQAIPIDFFGVCLKGQTDSEQTKLVNVYEEDVTPIDKIHGLFFFQGGPVDRAPPALGMRLVLDILISDSNFCRSARNSKSFSTWELYFAPADNRDQKYVTYANYLLKVFSDLVAEKEEEMKGRLTAYETEKGDYSKLKNKTDKIKKALKSVLDETVSGLDVDKNKLLIKAPKFKTADTEKNLLKECKKYISSLIQASKDQIEETIDKWQKQSSEFYRTESETRTWVDELKPTKNPFNEYYPHLIDTELKEKLKKTVTDHAQKINDLRSELEKFISTKDHECGTVPIITGSQLSADSDSFGQLNSTNSAHHFWEQYNKVQTHIQNLPTRGFFWASIIFTPLAVYATVFVANWGRFLATPGNANPPSAIQYLFIRVPPDPSWYPLIIVGFTSVPILILLCKKFRNSWRNVNAAYAELVKVSKKIETDYETFFQNTVKYRRETRMQIIRKALANKVENLRERSITSKEEIITANIALSGPALTAIENKIDQISAGTSSLPEELNGNNLKDWVAGFFGVEPNSVDKGQVSFEVEGMTNPTEYESRMYFKYDNSQDVVNIVSKNN